jgi:hypothetical protein
MAGGAFAGAPVRIDRSETFKSTVPKVQTLFLLIIPIVAEQPNRNV